MSDRVPSFGDKIMVKTHDGWVPARVRRKDYSADGIWLHADITDGRKWSSHHSSPHWRWPGPGEWDEER